MTWRKDETWRFSEVTELTVLKAVSVAIHRAFAPDILKAENWRASRRIEGWMSPLAALTSFGSPKWENIRRLRALAAAGSLIDMLLDSRGPFAPGVGGGFGVPSPLFVGLFEIGGAVMGGGGPGFGPGFTWEPPGVLACCFAALAARCFSCSSLLSAFVIFFWDLAWGCWVEGPSVGIPFVGWVERSGAGILGKVCRGSQGI